jgi:ASC-1-like (ASCH) protein
MEARIYNAIVLNEPYAEFVKQKIKTIETRMKKSIPVGDIIICCDGNKSKNSKNAGKAICIVHVDERREMTKEDELDACIEYVPKRIAFPLSNWRYFSYDFKFTDYKVGGSYQSIFQVKIPDFVQITQ